MRIHELFLPFYTYSHSGNTAPFATDNSKLSLLPRLQQSAAFPGVTLRPSMTPRSPSGAQYAGDVRTGTTGRCPPAPIRERTSLKATRYNFRAVVRLLQAFPRKAPAGLLVGLALLVGFLVVKPHPDTYANPRFRSRMCRERSLRAPAPSFFASFASSIFESFLRSICPTFQCVQIETSVVYCEDRPPPPIMMEGTRAPSHGRLWRGSERPRRGPLWH